MKTIKIQFEASEKANDLLKTIKKVSILKDLDLDTKPEICNLALELLSNVIEQKILSVEKLANTIK
jgi:uncharacterized protein (UPF0128 family)